MSKFTLHVREKDGQVSDLTVSRAGTLVILAADMIESGRIVTGYTVRCDATCPGEHHTATDLRAAAGTR